MSEYDLQCADHNRQTSFRCPATRLAQRDHRLARLNAAIKDGILETLLQDCADQLGLFLSVYHHNRRLAHAAPGNCDGLAEHPYQDLNEHELLRALGTERSCTRPASAETALEEALKRPRGTVFWLSETGRVRRRFNLAGFLDRLEFEFFAQRCPDHPGMLYTFSLADDGALLSRRAAVPQTNTRTRPELR
ncbi:hypothetical protein HNR42_000267 [Deinobacterium chartae]|uniref:Uncharacterized protein n=1 Tax=Deinobacterium chartae TaxID=521158 RepID=A0A841HYJ5_9DEIO|nr:hypothetical protein [Deinobacterium chartae]MBB6096855.1 hypothetical protein [Deinobacterium chartae]